MVSYDNWTNKTHRKGCYYNASGQDCANAYSLSTYYPIHFTTLKPLAHISFLQSKPIHLHHSRKWTPSPSYYHGTADLAQNARSAVLRWVSKYQLFLLPDEFLLTRRFDIDNFCMVIIFRALYFPQRLVLYAQTLLLSCHMQFLMGGTDDNFRQLLRLPVH